MDLLLPSPWLASRGAVVTSCAPGWPRLDRPASVPFGFLELVSLEFLLSEALARFGFVALLESAPPALAGLTASRASSRSPSASSRQRCVSKLFSC